MADFTAGTLLNLEGMSDYCHTNQKFGIPICKIPLESDPIAPRVRRSSNNEPMRFCEGNQPCEPSFPLAGDIHLGVETGACLCEGYLMQSFAALLLEHFNKHLQLPRYVLDG